MRRLLLVLLAALAVAFGWRRRGHVKSVAIRRLAAALPNPAKRRGLDIRIPVDRGGWIRLTLKADLSRTLSEVVGYPVEGAAYSHFGGYNLSRVYADFVNPDSDYYQAWLGAYVVFDNERREHFGFDDEGQPVQREALDVLEADQRLVLGGAGCPNRFPDGRFVQLIGDMTVAEVDSGGERWWKLDGRADTWSAYHRGRSPGGGWRSEAGYGRVPDGAPHPVDDLGVRRAFQQAYRLPELPSPEEMRRIAEPWRPYRSVGTWYMWRALGVDVPEQGRGYKKEDEKKYEP